MRHKWMVIMVVMVTTLTTAQEALKQYDSLKEQAATWASSGLWAGLLNSYEEAPQAFRAQSETCSLNQPGQESQPSYSPAFAQTIRIEIVKADRQQPQAARPAGGKSSARSSAREVALLAATRELEMSAEQVQETAGPISALPAGRDEDEVELAGHTLRSVRLVSFAPGRASDETATRAQSQKAKAMKKALRLLQLQIDRAARQELSRAERETIIELPDELAMTLVAADDAIDSIAANLPAPPPPPAALPATMTVSSSGGCAGE